MISTYLFCLLIGREIRNHPLLLRPRHRSLLGCSTTQKTNPVIAVAVQDEADSVTSSSKGNIKLIGQNDFVFEGIRKLIDFNRWMWIYIKLVHVCLRSMCDSSRNNEFHDTVRSCSINYICCKMKHQS